ncbi:ATP-binding protein [uncultured Corynebacterium sp.]|uniref:ATP-binding protein n=1 Tax=uncultured Corynebacterium sp. TaxID=159447 RepID=UPI002889E522|nr:ATP-binding protein [uncultured Corynebacterium sp.]
MLYTTRMSYLRRTLDDELDLLMPHLPAIAIDGPKGVGKTDTARRRANAAWYLDDPDMRNVAEADFSLSSAPDGTLLLDEWQHLPQIWDSVRRQVDQGAGPGRFLLTGSATPVDPKGSHSGAGRIVSLRMRPMAVHERGVANPTCSFAGILAGNTDVSGSSDCTLDDYARLITGSGFPAIASANPLIQVTLLDSYIERIIDRDIPDAGYEVRRPESLRSWLRAYAAATATTTAYSRLLDATTGGQTEQPNQKTTLAYREHLAKIWLLDPVPGWVPENNEFKRLQQGPKHHLADPALAARLLGISSSGLLSNRAAHMFGPLFESLCALTLRVLAQANRAKVYHLRSNAGEREVDFIIEGAEREVLGVEVKLKPHIDDADVRHLLWLRERIPDRVTNLMVLTTGKQAYVRRDGVIVMPLALLGN